jgi:hypothetical protein
MTQGDFLDWLTEDYGDRRVQRQLESELQEEAAYQARQASEIRSQMARLQGSLEQRIDRLEKAFYAFIEFSDLRAELAVFEDEATVRHAAQRLLRGLLRNAADPRVELPALPAELPGCHGYWLRPAVQSLSAAISGDEHRAAVALEEAQEFDPVRTAVFLAASLALAGQAPRAYPMLGAALQQPGERVTYAQRALWNACASGAYGETGEKLIREWLEAYIRGLDAESARTERSRWSQQASSTFEVARFPDRLRRGLPSSLSRNEALTTPLVNAKELSALSAWVREAITGEPVTSEPATAAATATRAAAAAAPPPVAALAAVAAALTEEGSHDEIALSRRARELREIFDDRKAARRPSWDDAQDATLTLLRDDAFGSDLRLRRVAIETCGDWITMLADRLAKDAVTEPPSQVEITVDRHKVQLAMTGQVSLFDAVVEIKREKAPQGADKLFGRKQAAEEIDRATKWVTTVANEAAAALVQRGAELRAAAQQAETDRDAITAALRRP